MAELVAREKALVKACEAKNEDLYATFFAPDVEMWGPEGPPTVGKPAVVAGYKDILPTVDLSTNSEYNIQEFGDIGFMAFTMDIEGESYKIFKVWKKVGGEWLLWRDIFMAA